MNRTDATLYRCPATGSKLRLEVTRKQGARIIEGLVVSKEGVRYPIKEGIPDFTYPREITEVLNATRNLYEERADVYDQYLPLTFKTFYEDEDTVRQQMVDKLNLQSHYRVLDLAAGSGRDSINIAKRLSEKGSLYVQDLSLSMLQHAVKRLEKVKCSCHFSLGNGAYLPFPDNFFDAAFNFGSMGEFDEKSRAFSELARVVKPGGKVVVGDENLPVWLRGRTKFADILLNYNKQYAFGLPLEHLPIEARKVRLEWIIGGVFYLIDFEVGEGEPRANFTFKIPGARGGTHMTRYLGQLEGVTVEAKKLAHQARALSGKSMHDWLDEVVREAAEREIKSSRQPKLRKL